MAVEVRDRPQAHRPGLTRVGPRDPALAEVRDRAHPLFLQFVERRGHYRRRLAVKEFRAEIAVALGPADPFARLVGAVDRAAVPQVADHRIGVEARRDDPVRGALCGLVQRPARLAEIEGDAHHAGDAVREPQFITISRVRRLARVAIMAVDVDEAGKDCHPRRVDFSRRASGLAVGLERQSGSAGGVDRGDPVAFDGDVDRPERRSAGSIDQ